MKELEQYGNYKIRLEIQKSRFFTLFFIGTGLFGMFLILHMFIRCGLFGMSATFFAIFDVVSFCLFLNSYHGSSMTIKTCKKKSNIWHYFLLIFLRLEHYFMF